MQDRPSPRQTQLLKVIIDEYIDSAAPVGSLALEKKYDLGVSPATIRNEMATLTDKGYLKQPHTSAGRVPTSKAMKFYINQLMEEKRLSVTEEVSARENVWDVRHNLDKLMNEATRSLARNTHALAIATTDSGEVWSSGYANVFDEMELISQQVCQNIFQFIEEQKRLEELFFKRFTGISPIEVLFGEELGWDSFEPVGFVSTRINLGDKQAVIAVVGPVWFDYAQIIPTVRYYGKLLEEVASK